MTQDDLKQILDYNPETGNFTWRISIRGTKGKGKLAGTVAWNGYRDVCIRGKKYGLHRLAFLYMNGEIPKCVDHRNGVKEDNRWVNLRPASYNQNGYNYKGTGSSTGYKNVYYDSRGNKKYFVAITANGIRKSYGYYMTPEEASLSATLIRNSVHKEFAHHGNEIERV